MVQIIVNDGANSASLAEKLSRLVTALSDKKFKGFLIVNNGDGAALERMAADAKITNVCIATLKDGRDAAGNDVFALLKINPKAKNTALVYKHKRMEDALVDVDAEKFGDLETAVKKMVK